MPARDPDKFLTWHKEDGELLPFKWDGKKTKAAAMVAEGISHNKIGAALGIEPRTVSFWR